MALSSHFPLPKAFHSSKQFAFFVKFALSNGVTGDRSSNTNDRTSGSTVLLLIEKMNQINTKKLLEIEKEIAREVALGPWDKHLQIEKHKNQDGVRSAHRTR